MKKENKLDTFLMMELYEITANAPPMLKEAMFHAVFPGGGRVRPQLCIKTAEAVSLGASEASLAAAAAVELIHCASLVHDDMPCFDDADVRRGLPSVHKKFGERIALLVGDGLIVAAFEVLSKHAARHPRFGEMVRVLSAAAGASNGLVSGQAWEDQPTASVRTVHDRKTGALFEAATAMGALAAGADPEPWRPLGNLLGAAYQAADDLLDAVGRAEVAGKPVLQDQGRQVKSLVTSVGLRRAIRRFHRLAEEAAIAVPECAGRDSLRSLVGQIAERLCPPAVIAAARRDESALHDQNLHNEATSSVSMGNMQS